MPILRVLLSELPAAGVAVPWALFDDQQRHQRSGAGVPAEWPRAERREAVLAASAVRIASVALPPMPADRVPAAAAFALEDQLAGGSNTQHLTASPRRADGAVEVAIASRALVAALQRDFARVIAEPAASPLPGAGAWRWYRSQAGGGFVRKPDGSAFALSAPSPGRTPDELALALAHAVRAGTPPRVEVAFPVDDSELAAWSAQCGARFERAVAWHWDQDGAPLAAAPDLLHGEFSRTPAAPARTFVQRLAWPLGIAAAALALHVAATLVEWAVLRYDTWQVERSLIEVARAAGAGDAATGDAASAALARRFADARHRARQPAPDDALPLLARTAPALAALPAGTLKSASYGAGSWTFDLGKLAPPAMDALDRTLTLAGVGVLAATSASGTRVRATLARAAALP
ncbi:MAG: type II secretion system protein GspL [Burkholderiales bacterium]